MRRTGSDEPYTEADAERDRLEAIRTFRVEMLDATVETVCAHFWENSGPAGHWNFYTIDSFGQNRIRNSFSCHLVAAVTETTEITSPPMTRGGRQPVAGKLIARMPPGKM